MATSQQRNNVLQIPALLEKTAKLPAGRMPLMAFVSDGETEGVLHECLAQLPAMQHLVMRGGIMRALQYLAGERSPTILFVDISGVELALARIHELADICEPGVTVIAIGEHNDVELYRDLMEAGVTDYVVKPVTRQRLAKALAAKTGAGETAPISQRLGKVVAFIGARGGVGTTTLATNLAWYLAHETKRRVGLVDLDLHNGDCALTLNIKPTPGLREALVNPFRVDPVFLERTMAVQGERLFVLSCEEPLRDHLQFNADAPARLVSVLRTQMHCVILDVPRIPAEPYRRALDLADFRVIVADQTLHAVRDAARLRALLGERIAEHLNLLVVNRAGEGGTHAVTLKEMQEVIGIRPRTVIPFQPKLFARAASGTGIAATGHGAFTGALAALAGEIFGRSSERRAWWRLRK
jgi:pilus assembly protein CpaE